MRYFLFLILSFVAVCSQAQTKETVTVKGGTIISVTAAENLKAADANVGDRVNFRVVRDVVVNGKVAIPSGTLVLGKVTQAKKSSCFGTKGRLSINLSHVLMSDGTTVPFTNSNVNISGKNRTAASVVVFLFTLVPLPCGTRAELIAGQEYEAMVASSTEVVPLR
ncbi:MAG: hypothetical protein ACI3YC_09180 [Alloprevotella sp.]